MTNTGLVVFDKTWLNRISATVTGDSWIDGLLPELDGAGRIYLDTLRAWFHRFPASNKQKRSLKAGLESYDSNHLGAVNELSWWELMKLFGWSADPIPKSSERRPDFHVTQPSSFFCEVTTLNFSKRDTEALNKGDGVALDYSQTIERIVRKITNDKIQQIQYGAAQQKPSVLVLFDCTPWGQLATDFYQELANYLYQNHGFYKLPDDLSTIVYVERKFINGQMAISKERAAVYYNPKSTFQMPRYSMHLQGVVPGEDASYWRILPS